MLHYNCERKNAFGLLPSWCRFAESNDITSIFHRKNSARSVQLFIYYDCLPRAIELLSELHYSSIGWERNTFAVVRSIDLALAIIKNEWIWIGFWTSTFIKYQKLPKPLRILIINRKISYSTGYAAFQMIFNVFSHLNNQLFLFCLCDHQMLCQAHSLGYRKQLADSQNRFYPYLTDNNICIYFLVFFSCLCNISCPIVPYGIAWIDFRFSANGNWVYFYHFICQIWA